jgi:hypothetical protein
MITPHPNEIAARLAYCEECLAPPKVQCTSDSGKILSVSHQLRYEEACRAGLIPRAGNDIIYGREI